MTAASPGAPISGTTRTGANLSNTRPTGKIETETIGCAHVDGLDYCRPTTLLPSIWTEPPTLRDSGETESFARQLLTCGDYRLLVLNCAGR